MYYHLNGELCLAQAHTAVIDCGGVGYKLTVSNTTLSQISHKIGEKVKLYTYLAVREDAMELFGFHSVEEHSAFTQLISVSGVGPKAAISVLSTFTPEQFAAAVCSADTKILGKASGIGAKTAARIVLELKDKISKDQMAGDLASLKDPIVPQKGGTVASGKLSEAEDALSVLGYSRAEITAVLRTIDTASLSLEDIIKAALRRFSEK